MDSWMDEKQDHLKGRGSWKVVLGQRLEPTPNMGPIAGKT